MREHGWRQGWRRSVGGLGAWAGATVLLVAVSVLPAPAAAQCVSPAPTTTLNDVAGYIWDIWGNGQIGNGTGDSYDQGMALRVDGSYFPGTSHSTELGGRQVVVAPATLSGLTVTRKIYVPTTERWARFLEIFANPGGAAVAATVRIETNCGSDGSTVVTGSSSGDTVYTTADRWVTTDDIDSGGDPSLNHNFWGPGAGVMPSLVGNSVFDCAATNGVFAEFNITVPAGGTVILMHFGGQNTNQADSRTNAAAIDLLPAAALAGLSGELAYIVNWGSRRTCDELHAAAPGLASGAYLLDPDGLGGSAPVSVYCDMTTDDGGWTLVASTLGTTLDDEASAYYADLATLSPVAGHAGIWTGLRPVLGPTGDVRFSCRNGSASGPFAVDLVFYNVGWYQELTAGANAATCFEEGDGAGATTPAPPRRDLVAATTRSLGNPWDCAGYLEGEDACGDADDFTVDFDDGGMNCNETDGTDWGEDDATAKCGSSLAAPGSTWFVWVRAPAAPRCGDGLLDFTEACDDGNTVACDGCRADCSDVESGCGDGYLCGAEVCDDGNGIDCDGCRADCSARETGCGDRFVCGAEVCDDGNNLPCDGCRNNCTVIETGCGDGYRCGAEACDDGNADDCDGCRADCSAAETGCGDGFLCGAEVCDDGNAEDCDGCRADCSASETGCGDGFLCGLEACDDGNAEDGDGCRADCSALETGCGDGVSCGAEACDDGNAEDCDGCRADCSAAETGCGDGFLCGAEVCDDGNADDCDGCPSDCSVVETGCGDGVVCGAEACDDGNADDCDGCRADCSAAETGCGDGFLCGAEACDDGNAAAGDGCGAACAVEHGFTCAGEPSVCAGTCGDGLVAADEACDDGNRTPGDGCGAACDGEPGWSCSGEPSVCGPGCGDGAVAAGEDCDDGNTTAGDGCGVSCDVEHGFVCSGAPSACAPVCGDGLVAADEACDDGNAAAGDGCSEVCVVETGYACTGEPSECTRGAGSGGCGCRASGGGPLGGAAALLGLLALLGLAVGRRSGRRG
ncbi:MAG: DUF4215 domain-containing protein [Deltaproteobacteria bacterium]|nr:DUF4215 domain-containing protein [Deltaproteobacteria bacterium]